VTGPATPATGAAPDPACGPGGGIARGAVLIAGLTIVSRLLGLARTLVFAQTVGAGCLGTAYVTASQVPNLIYELVLGGALTSAMVPILARPAGRAQSDPAARAQVSQVTAALLTWSVIILVPLTLLVMAAAGALAGLLDPANPHSHCVRADVVATTASMLRVFAPQILLYGFSVVLFGLLQAYRRFTAPALAPVIATLVLIASYLAFVPLARGLPLARLPALARLVLAAGATVAVAALVIVPAIPAGRLRLRLRPVLRFPSGVGRRAGGLALVGVAELAASDLQSLGVIALANGRGETGAVVIFNYAWLAFSAMYAVLAVSIAVSAFPVLSARDGPAFDETCAASARAVLLASCLGAAGLAAIAVPAAHVLARTPGQVPELTGALALFAPGLPGLGVIAGLSRAMLAAGRLTVAAAALAGSWLAALAADVVLAGLAPPRLVPAALALGVSAGATLVAGPLVLAARRIRGPAAVRGLGRAALAGLTAATAGAAAGVGISLLLPVTRRLAAGGAAVLAATAAAVVFGAVAYLLDDGDLRAVLARRRIGRPRQGGPGSGGPDGSDGAR
jgi:putative peptidoglycan lipid II flippase